MLAGEGLDSFRSAALTLLGSTLAEGLERGGLALLVPSSNDSSFLLFTVDLLGTAFWLFAVFFLARTLFWDVDLPSG
jgi:hypothetical protein